MKYSLVYRFNDAWEKISKKYEKESSKFPRKFVTTPTVAFHGTKLGNLPSIGIELLIMGMIKTYLIHNCICMRPIISAIDSLRGEN